MGLLLVLPLVTVPVLAVLVAAGYGRALRRYAGVVESTVVLACGLGLAALVLDDQTVTALDGQLRADALSAFMLIVTGSVGLTATWGGVDRDPAADPGRQYPMLIVLFLGAMSLAVLADNLGVLWVAIEATTIATAFLVGHHRTRRSLEAAWKYVVIGSVGVAIAFLGIVMLYAATRAAGAPTLSWSTLQAHPADLDPSLVKVAAALAILGFATKAGLAPMHSWLPDAHSQAPAPVSGLMSGVLLSVAFYGILRVEAVARPVIGLDMMRSSPGRRGPAVPRSGRRSRAPAARSEAHARVLEHRAHGAARARRGHRQSACDRCGTAARPWSRPRQVEHLRRVRPNS